MAETIYRKKRKVAAESNPELKDAYDAGNILLIDRTRLLNIENGKILPRPEEVVAMAKAYNTPELCQYYCSKECQVGEFKGAPNIEELNFSKIAVELLSVMHFFDQTQDMSFKIFKDSEISESETEEFKKILKTLDELSAYSEALKLWAKQKGIIE